MIAKTLKSAFLVVWTVVGIILIVLAFIAMTGEGTWTENLNLSAAPAEVEGESTTQQTAPQQQQPQQQPQQPTQEQLACVSEALGEERLAELEQGAQAESEEEAATIQQCLQS